MSMLLAVDDDDAAGGSAAGGSAADGSAAGGSAAGGSAAAGSATADDDCYIVMMITDTDTEISLF